MFYLDGDADGYGDLGSSIQGLSSPVWDGENSDDCDDQDDEIHPDAIAEICDGVDNNCDGLTDDDDPAIDVSSQSTFYMDYDADGFGDDLGQYLHVQHPICMSILGGL